MCKLWKVPTASRSVEFLCEEYCRTDQLFAPFEKITAQTSQRGEHASAYNRPRTSLVTPHKHISALAYQHLGSSSHQYMSSSIARLQGSWTWAQPHYRTTEHEHIGTGQHQLMSSAVALHRITSSHQPISALIQLHINFRRQPRAHNRSLSAHPRISASPYHHSITSAAHQFIIPSAHQQHIVISTVICTSSRQNFVSYESRQRKSVNRLSELIDLFEHSSFCGAVRHSLSHQIVRSVQTRIVLIGFRHVELALPLFHVKISAIWKILWQPTS